MSIRGNADGTGTPLVGDGNVVPTPTPGPYATHDAAALHSKSIKIMPTHSGRPVHVPLCESSKTDIHRAVRTGDPAALADLLEKPGMKEKIDAQDMFGFTALHMACQTVTTGSLRGLGHPGTIACGKVLIDAGASVNVHTTEDQWAQTPLHLAVSSLYPQVEICGYLIDAKVDLCAVDVYGCTALHNAAMGTHLAQLRVLTAHPDWEAAVAVKNKRGETALQLADEVVKRQTKKVEIGPNHDEVRMLLATRKGFEQIEDKKTGAAKK